MNQRTRLAAGAAIAGVLVTAPPALADSGPNPAGVPDSPPPVGPMATIPLPDEIGKCLLQNGLPDPLTGTTVGLPDTTGTLPADLTGTIPLSGIGVPSSTTTIPLSGIGVPGSTGANPLSGVGAPGSTGANPLSGVGAPGSTGANPLSGVGVPSSTGTGGLQCGQMIVNNAVYLVLVTVTNTTTTTASNGPMTAAAGPVSVTGNAPAAGPVTTAPVTKGKRSKHRSARRKHSAHRRAQRGIRALHIVLVRRSGGHAGRGS
jgi:hypothetical protein